eukprot:TRINITY_DN11668_c1_g2_i1.p1 TRINITY_DN11668_c1_g2~~TRINITY_DN11668_c1_g2_i1.p1  ORF type:complete len:226 (-),score=54.68 TRINITY_DN11668_c1_g2_i1:50-727(-)
MMAQSAKRAATEAAEAAVAVSTARTRLPSGHSGFAIIAATEAAAAAAAAAEATAAAAEANGGGADSEAKVTAAAAAAAKTENSAVHAAAALVYGDESKTAAHNVAAAAKAIFAETAVALGETAVSLGDGSDSAGDPTSSEEWLINLPEPLLEAFDCEETELFHREYIITGGRPSLEGLGSCYACILEKTKKQVRQCHCKATAFCRCTGGERKECSPREARKLREQ